MFYSFLLKFTLFTCSAGVGMISYLLFAAKDTGAESKRPIPTTTTIAISSVENQLDLPIEATLLTKVYQPVDVSGDAYGSLYVLQKNGHVVRVGDEATSATISDSYANLANENTDETLGFSALAFHPEFLIKGKPGYGKFYAVAAEKAHSGEADFSPEYGAGLESHQDVVYEFVTDTPSAATFNGSQREVIRFSQPGPQNNVKSLAFDPQGYLYIAVGDGADSEITHQSISKNASSLGSAFGKILRIDPQGRDSHNGQYGIPKTNPFQMVSEALPELWAFGLRAPHSLSFDPFLESLYISESDQTGLEKVNVSKLGGEHFGWDLMQGAGLLNLMSTHQLADIVTTPTFSMNRTEDNAGKSSGNIVYRGECFPSLEGSLIVAHESGGLIVSSPGTINDVQILDPKHLAGRTISSLRTAPDGEMLILCGDGSVFKITKTESTTEGSWKRKPLYCAVETAVADQNS